MKLLICVTPPKKLLNLTIPESSEKLRLVYEYFDELSYFMQTTFGINCTNVLDRFKNLLLHTIWKSEHKIMMPDYSEQPSTFLQKENKVYLLNTIIFYTYNL